jgi:hypothetical protein
MSEQSASGTGTPGSSKKRVSIARNAIGVVVLLALLAVGWLEYSSIIGYNAAVKALETRTQDEDKDLMEAREAESLMGKSPDDPGSDVNETDRNFIKKTYTWKGLLQSHTLTAFYTKEAAPHLHHFETEGAKYAAATAERSALTTTEAPVPTKGAPAGPFPGKGARNGSVPGKAAPTAPEPAKVVPTAPEPTKVVPATPAPEEKPQ